MSKAVKLLLFLLLGCGSSLGQTQTRVSNCDIQTAIDKCAGSCTISVSAGTCNLSAALTWAGTGKRINLECAGRNQTVLVCPEGVQCINPDSNSRIAHCDLRGPKVPSPGNAIINSGGTTDVVIEDNIIERASDQGLNTGGGSLRWTIRNNLVQNNPGDGIFLASGTSDSVVADNIVINNGSNGIDCNGSGNTFHGNVSNSNGLPGGDIDRNGILISGISNGSSADHNSVVGNETNYNGGSGINIRADSGTTANYNIVSGNVSHDNSGTHNNGDGISIDGSDVLGTWIGNAVVGNTVYHNQRYGIEVDGQSAKTIQNTLISSNVANSNGNTGIIVANPKVEDTLIVNNLAMGNGSAQIFDYGTTRAVIAGNLGSSPSLNLGVAPGSSSSATVQAGETATYTLSIGGQGMGGSASLSCTGAPKGARCLVPGSQSTNAAVPSVFNVLVTTTSPTAGVLHPPHSNSQPQGTPPGTYTLTVAAVSGSISQSTSLALTVLENQVGDRSSHARDALPHGQR